MAAKTAWPTGTTIVYTAQIGDVWKGTVVEEDSRWRRIEWVEGNSGLSWMRVDWLDQQAKKLTQQRTTDGGKDPFCSRRK